MSVPFRLRAPRATEHAEQVALLRYAAIEARRDARWALLFAVTNGMAASSLGEAARAKAAGLKRGVPDLFLPIPVAGSGDRVPWHGCFIELKRTGGVPSDVSPAQRAWLARLSEQGYRAVVAYGWLMARDEIHAYLETPS